MNQQKGASNTSSFFELEIEGLDVNRMSSELLRRSSQRQMNTSDLESSTTPEVEGRHGILLQEQLQTLATEAELLRFSPARSNVRYAGPVLAFLKRLMQYVIKGLFGKLLQRQSKWNRASYQVQSYQLKVIQELEDRIQSLEHQLESER